MEKTKSGKKKKIICTVIIGFLILLVGFWWILTVSIYNQNFNVRGDSYEPLSLRVSDFEGLQCDEYRFASDKGQMLNGYFYSAGDNQKGIIVMAHGFGGGGHNSYMDAAAYFASKGYYVFAYDATGCDKSEGKGVGGIPQGAIDLDYAISFVESKFDLHSLPILLFGHSWGGYSVCTVLNYHPEVKAVIECSGSNKSSDLFEAGGLSQVGGLMYTMMPFAKIHERIKYGKYAADTAMDGLAATDARIMIVHSEDDGVIPIRYGYDIFYEKYKDDSRFTFLRFEDKGHNNILKDPDNNYAEELDAGFAEWLKTLDYDYLADDNSNRFAEDKAG